MGGKTVYTGEIMQDVVDALLPLVSEMQSMVENTKYIKNLYDSNGLRSSKTFSSADNSLIPKANNLTDFVVSKSTNNAEITSSSFGVYLNCTQAFSAVGSITATMTLKLPVGAKKIRYKALSENSNGTSSIKFNTVAGIVTNVETDYIIADGLTDLSIVLAAGSPNTGGAYGRLKVEKIDVLDIDNNIIISLVAPMYDITNNTISILSGNTKAMAILPPITGIIVSKWDLLNIMATKESQIKIWFRDINTGQIIANVIDGKYIGDFKSSTFNTYILIERTLTTDQSPILSGIAYRYVV